MPAAQNPDEPDADPGPIPPPQGAGDDDAAWRAIVDNYGERALLDDEPVPPPAEPEPEQDEADWFNATHSDDAFTPPDPEPLRVAPDRALAWAGVLGAPVAALVVAVLTSLTTWHSPGWLLWLLVAAFLGGFGFLVATMPREREDPWDDGARL